MVRPTRLVVAGYGYGSLDDHEQAPRLLGADVSERVHQQAVELVDATCVGRAERDDTGRGCWHTYANRDQREPMGLGMGANRGLGAPTQDDSTHIRGGVTGLARGSGMGGRRLRRDQASGSGSWAGGASADGVSPASGNASPQVVFRACRNSSRSARVISGVRMPVRVHSVSSMRPGATRG